MSEIKPDQRLEKGRRRRRALVDAARDLFLTHGYRGTTLEAIIARAGGSREMIYESFGGKRGLFGAIVSERGERLAASIREADEIRLPPLDGLTRLGLQLMAIWSTDEARAVHHIVFSEGLDAPEIMEAWYRGGTELSLAELTRYIADQRAAGLIETDEPFVVARQFLLLLMAEAAFPVISGGTGLPDAAAAVARTVGVIVRAYAPREGRTDAKTITDSI